MSAYHSTELCFLATVYSDLMIRKRPLDLYFKPIPNGFKDRILRVSPDMLPKGSVSITACTIDGAAYSNFNTNGLYVQLPDSAERLNVKVTLTPN